MLEWSGPGPGPGPGLGLGELFRNNFENNRRGLKLGNNCINWGIIGANYIDQ